MCIDLSVMETDELLSLASEIMYELRIRNRVEKALEKDSEFVGDEVDWSSVLGKDDEFRTLSERNEVRYRQ